MKLEFHNAIIFSTVHTILMISCLSAARCDHACGGRQLPFPFGFSAGCQINLNCSTTGEILIGDFPVESVSAKTILVNLPPGCHRPVEALRRLFTANFAPISQNTFFMQDCGDSTSDCLIPMTMVKNHFKQRDCDDGNANISCYSETNEASSFIDYGNLTRSGCRSLFSAISMEAYENSSEIYLNLEVVRVGWWLRGGCRCSKNAKCIAVSPPLGDGGSTPAFRCECFEGFAGDGFLDGVGCHKGNHSRSRSKRSMVPLVILSSTLVLAAVAFFVFVRRKQKKIETPTITWQVVELPRISFIELERGTSCFSESNKLGRGSFGSVFQAILFDGSKVAVKVYDLQLHGAMRSFETEAKILSNIRHRNLVRVIGCCSNVEFKALILTYMPNGSLDKWLYSNNNHCLDLTQRLKIAVDVAAALEYLHHGYTSPIVHCDIKPSNVLLNHDLTAHLSDFGISKLFEGDDQVFIHTQTLGTIGYAAPELGTEGKVSTNGDVYSFGIMLLEMFTGKRPTDDMFDGEILTLPSWASEALQQNTVTEIVAASLLSREDQYDSAYEQCLSSIFELAIQCLPISANERINMIEAATALHKINAAVAAIDLKSP